MLNQQTPFLCPRYRTDIDGLRALAVLAVVAFHAFPSFFRGGFIGVDVFFVISGYLISTIIFENLDKGTFSFAEFYARRIKRIFPALVIVLAACFVFGWFALLADEYKQLGKHIAAGAVFVSNFVLWNESGYFDNSSETKPLLHLWSLGLEEQFYIIWPVILWLAWKCRFNFLTIATFAAVISFLLNFEGIKSEPVATFYSPQTRFWELLSGSILAWLVLYKKSSYSILKNRIDSFLFSVTKRENAKIEGKLCSNIFSVIGFLLLLYGFCIINKELSFPGNWALVPVLGSVLLIFAGNQAWINHKILSNKIIVWFGLISFPLYLWHWPLLAFARIVESEMPSLNIRIVAVIFSILFAWLTYQFIERPIRQGRFVRHGKIQVSVLVALMTVLGFLGYYTYSRTDLCSYRGYEDIIIKRKEFEHVFGCSLFWYKGKSDWLFLGNQHGNTVAKLKLAIQPSEDLIKKTNEPFVKIASSAARYNTKISLILGPNKSSIYPEYLPEKLIPSPVRYSSFFIQELKKIPNLIVYDPTEDLLDLKSTQGVLYYRTDTHWNNKGAFIAYSGFSRLLGLAIPEVRFKNGGTHSGDLIDISQLKNFPLHSDDNWDVIWNSDLLLTEIEKPDEKVTSFGSVSFVKNKKAISDLSVWVVGDSFTKALRQYFNATFKDVRYVGHWSDKLDELPTQLENADKKPDLIVIVRVERSF